MTTRRKRPDRKSGRFPVVAGLFRSAGDVIVRHPSIAGGVAAFAVTFAFVSINALVYQPGVHPAPLYTTRTIVEAQRLVPVGEVPVPSSRVTTFKIEHKDPQSTASIPRRNAQPANPTVESLQQAMRSGGIYEGIVDGVLGPKTENAIRAYQEKAGLEPTGSATDTLLVHMLISELDTVAVPKPKPARDTSVTQLIADDAVKAERTGPAADDAGSVAPADPVADLITEIQKGLSNIAYSEVKVDGVIGEQTTSAIADFQRHYRLPVTGQPDKLVLKKLHEIGAL
ncbi:peptidoglycan-binding domain-containing protein [Hoeflea prorocentri]|uniref:Peptidoglycan-binding domain-containing protein n=1 Tax=Hoeflea prorocentri TaxID=1922333 RepID=A0A9X3UIL5_9HYPH|nr:peptidoglycan-binding domain-containing protein [Hoeflea prorocentri]MCY6381518.1 peptidoglycan-binding domain-containing protein [Hoeflea prorocentri]MDA5399318.1 peptidoglycan-binding domain-containing protein [Hoeflea prorocentri]